MIVTIKRKRWELVFLPPSQMPTEDGKPIRGQCDGPGQTKKKIKINNSLRGEERVEVIIHEMLHAADWDKDEEWVEQVAEDIARVLHKLNLLQEAPK